MKYNVGDIVTIRHDLEDSVEYGEWIAIDYMVSYRGTQQVINSVYHDYYLLDGLKCKWTDEMFEDREPNYNLSIDLSDFV